MLESAGMVGARDLMTVLADGRLSEDESNLRPGQLE